LGSPLRCGRGVGRQRPRPPLRTFRSAAADRAADDAFGITEIVVGTGGAGLRGLDGSQPNSAVRNATTWGVVRLDLTDTGYSGQFVPVAGKAFHDSFSGSCHGAPGGTPAPTPSSGGAFTLSATPGTGQVDLSWTAVAGANTYRVRRATGNGSFGLVAKVSTLSYADRSVTRGVTYRYRVVAVTSPSVKSNVVTVTAQ
jgi:hypothetical protein